MSKLSRTKMVAAVKLQPVVFVRSLARAKDNRERTKETKIYLGSWIDDEMK